MVGDGKNEKYLLEKKYVIENYFLRLKIFLKVI